MNGIVGVLFTIVAAVLGWMFETQNAMTQEQPTAELFRLRLACAEEGRRILKKRDF